MRGKPLARFLAGLSALHRISGPFEIQICCAGGKLLGRSALPHNKSGCKWLHVGAARARGNRQDLLRDMRVADVATTAIWSSVASSSVSKLARKTQNGFDIR